LHGTKYGTPHSRADCEKTPASMGGRGTGTTIKGAGSEYCQPVGPYKFPKTGQTFAAANPGAPSSFSSGEWARGSGSALAIWDIRQDG